MLRAKTTNQFKRDFKLMQKQHRDIEKLKTAMFSLQKQERLEYSHRDHKLSRNYEGHRDCHIEPDWILIYRIDREAQTITFTRTGAMRIYLSDTTH